MTGLDARLAPYQPDGDKNLENRFFENLFPTDIFIIRKIMRALLPEMLYDQFIAWQEEQCRTRLRDTLSRYFSKPVDIMSREVVNYAPKHIAYSICFLSDPDVDAYTDHVQGYGASYCSDAEALSVATGEFLERYTLADDWNEEIRIATPRALGRSAVSLAHTPLFLPWQKEKVNSSFTTREHLEDTTLAWVKARSLLGIRSKYVPAHRVFWLRDEVKDEGLINHPTTNGAGGGFSYEEAALSALCELVERDSFMCHWLLKLTPPRISFNTITTPGIAQMRPYIRRYKLEVVFYDITTEIGIPTVACFLINRADSADPKVSVGAASSFDAERLFDKSFMEALTVQRQFLKSHERAQPETIRAEGHFDDVAFDKNDFGMRSRIWHGTEMMKHLSFLQQGELTTFDAFCSTHDLSTPRSSKEALREVKRKFGELARTYGEGFEPFIYRARHPILSKTHYTVVRAIIPNLFPLYLTEHRATLDISQQQHWQKTAEKRGRQWSGEIENAYPHPFL